MARALVTVAAALALAGCGGARSDSGIDSLLRVSKGQFYRGAPPTDTSGPALAQLNASSLIHPGQNDGSVGGLASPNATAVALYLEGDQGYWIITPTSSDPSNNFDLAFSAAISFSPVIPLGTYTLVGRAIDLNGHVGPPLTDKIKVMDIGSPTMAATLLVSLRWDSEADLDLHLVLPDNTEIFSQKINSYQGPSAGQQAGPNDYLAGGILDFDSNATCIIDGRRVENIYWTQTPPSGHYIARVETYSLCAEPQAIWALSVTNGGTTLGVAHGLSRDTDTLPPRGRGAGLTAIEFDVP
jgi:hypothetical protein